MHVTQVGLFQNKNPCRRCGINPPVTMSQVIQGLPDKLVGPGQSLERTKEGSVRGGLTREKKLLELDIFCNFQQATGGYMPLTVLAVPSSVYPATQGCAAQVVGAIATITNDAPGLLPRGNGFVTGCTRGLL